MDSIQTLKEARFHLRPYTFMVDSCNETHGSYEQEIVSNKNTGEELLIRKKISFGTRTEISLEMTNSEIFSLGFSTYVRSIRPLQRWSVTTLNEMP